MAIYKVSHFIDGFPTRSSLKTSSPEDFRKKTTSDDTGGPTPPIRLRQGHGQDFSGVTCQGADDFVAVAVPEFQPQLPGATWRGYF